MATLLAAGSALPFYNEQALAQRAMGRALPADAVKIDGPAGAFALRLEF